MIELSTYPASCSRVVTYGGSQGSLSSKLGSQLDRCGHMVEGELQV